MRETNPIRPRQSARAATGANHAKRTQFAGDPRRDEATGAWDAGQMRKTNPIWPGDKDGREPARGLVASLWCQLCETRPIPSRRRRGRGPIVQNEPNSRRHRVDREDHYQGRSWDQLCKTNPIWPGRQRGRGSGGRNAQNEPNSSIADCRFRIADWGQTCGGTLPAACRPGLRQAGCTNKPNWLEPIVRNRPNPARLGQGPDGERCETKPIAARRARQDDGRSRSCKTNPISGGTRYPHHSIIPPFQHSDLCCAPITTMGMLAY